MHKSKLLLQVVFLTVLMGFSSSLKSKTPNIHTLTGDGAWCWFADPRAVYHKGVEEKTYFGWITKTGDITLASYNHETGAYQENVIHEDLEADDHDNPSIFIRKDGRIIVFYSKHSVGPMYRVISDKPEDISSFGPTANFGKDVTYPNPFQVGDSIYLFYRGINWHPTVIISGDDGETWGEPQQVIKGGGARPYTKFTGSKDGAIHIAFTTAHPRQDNKNSIFYTCLKNGAFYKADGTFVKNFTGTESALDIDLGEADTVYNANKGKGWIWDIALEKDKTPVLVYAAFPEDTDHQYYYAKWNGDTWSNHHVSEGGSWFPQTKSEKREREPNYSGGIHLDHTNPSVLYLSKPVDGAFEIFRYKTKDEGKSWKSSQITEDTPEGIVNVRPFVPLNHKKGFFDVLWMRGKYIHYTDYDTGIMYMGKVKR